jgi:DNA-binding beta-propeller fold protein YncE
MAGKPLSRRTLLAAAFATACSRSLAPRYFGWLFIASAAEKGLAVADLSDFRKVTTISLGQTPSQVLRVGKKIFATCPDARLLFAVDPDSFRIESRMPFPGRIVSAAVCPNESRIAVITDQPAALHLVDPATRRIVRRIPLPAAPSGLDVSDNIAAVASASAHSIIRIALAAGAIAGVTDLAARPGVIRVHAGAKVILAGAADVNEIVSINLDSGAVLARLPMAFTPARFCLNPDGGQMFVTGTSGDEIAIVSPYQNEVDQTIVAGRTPYGMAVGVRGDQNLLFITNPASGDLTIFDIDTRQHASSVHVGGKPGEVLLTPDAEYALAVDQESGDVAVVRIGTVLDHNANKGPAPMAKPLFTIFHTGPDPQSAAIVPQDRSA